MIVLENTTDKIQVRLADAPTTNQLDYVGCWRNIGSDYTAKRKGIFSDGTSGAVDVVDPPASSSQNVVDFISVYNRDTASHTVEVLLILNTDELVLWKGTLLSGELLTYVDGNGWSVVGNLNSKGYAINVQALTSSPTDAQTVYFGMLPKAPVTAAGTSKVYIRKSGHIKVAEIYCYSGTAGTSENWSLYIRVNNTTDYLIQTLGVSANERVFSNTGLNIPVNAGDYIEIKGVQPTWATNPLTTIYGGYIYIE